MWGGGRGKPRGEIDQQPALLRCRLGAAQLTGAARSPHPPQPSKRVQRALPESCSAPPPLPPHNPTCACTMHARLHTHATPPPCLRACCGRCGHFRALAEQFGDVYVEPRVALLAAVSSSSSNGAAAASGDFGSGKTLLLP